MDNRGANAVQPCPLVGFSRSSEGRPRQLFTVEAVGTYLRIVLYNNGPVKTRYLPLFLFLLTLELRALQVTHILVLLVEPRVAPPWRSRYQIQGGTADKNENRE